MYCSLHKKMAVCGKNLYCSFFGLKEHLLALGKVRNNVKLQSC